jgi:hypothetical protein
LYEYTIKGNTDFYAVKKVLTDSTVIFSITPSETNITNNTISFDVTVKVMENEDGNPRVVLTPS